MFGLTFFGDICIGVAAYVAGAYTWPKFKQMFLGAETYAESLKARADAIIAAARGK